jgi:hypothetical protein
MKKNSGQKSRATVPLKYCHGSLFWLSYSSCPVLPVLSFRVADPYLKNADADPGKNVDVEADSCPC